MTVALFIAGVAVGLLLGVLAPFVAYAALSGDHSNDLQDDLTQISGAGGGEVMKHHGESSK